MWSDIVSWKLKSFSEKLGSYDFLLPLLVQRDEDLWEVPVGTPRAYKCKQILGLCQTEIAVCASQ